MLPLQDGIAITLLSSPAWLLSLHTLLSQNCCCIRALFSPVPTLPQRSLYRLLLGCQGTQNCSRQTGKNMQKLTKVCKLVQKLLQTWLLAVPRISRRRGKAAIAQSCHSHEMILCRYIDEASWSIRRAAMTPWIHMSKLGTPASDCP